MNPEDNTVDISDILRYYPPLDSFSLGNDFLICEVCGTRCNERQIPIQTVVHPLRFDGYLCMFCSHGDFQVEVNMKSYDIHPGGIFIAVPGSIFKITPMLDECHPDDRFICILTSREFMHNIRFDFSKSFQDSIRILRTPVIKLNQRQLEIAVDYLNLARKIIHSHLTHRKEVIGSLISSLAYTVADVWQGNISSAEMTENTTNDRLSALFDRFIALVSESCTQERNVGFYAEKLCLTPKYLSKLIKQASGRSAPDWIDAFVILEAKNLLKYSNISIKEIVFRLNFPNQSVFYKFFKTHTGMTPSEYRKGTR